MAVVYAMRICYSGSTKKERKMKTSKDKTRKEL